MVIRSTSTRLKAPSATLPIHFFFRLKENSLFLKFSVSFKDEIMDGIKSDFIQLQWSFVNLLTFSNEMIKTGDMTTTLEAQVDMD